MNFKSVEIRNQWNSRNIDPKLEVVVRYIDSLMQERYNVVACLTSIFREGDKGVHGAWRGIDVRVHNLLDGEAQEITDAVNSIFQYDSKRDLPVAYLHGEGSSLHIHLQVYVGERWTV